MRILALVTLAIVFTGCAGMDITEEPSHQAVAYLSGKGLAIGINSPAIPERVDPDLTAVWVDFMDRNKGKEIVESAEMLLLYNECIAVLTLHVDDPYGLIGDLTALMMIFGAQFTGEDGQGEMTSISPVPYSVLRWFELGYANGRRVADG